MPIGVDYDRIQQISNDLTLVDEMKKLKQELRLDSRVVGIGVDRLDYT